MVAASEDPFAIVFLTLMESDWRPITDRTVSDICGELARQEMAMLAFSLSSLSLLVLGFFGYGTLANASYYKHVFESDRASGA